MLIRTPRQQNAVANLNYLSVSAMNFATNYLRHCWMQTTTTPQRGAENGIISAGWSVREGEPKLDRILLLNHNENDKLRSSKVGGSRTEARQDENEGDIIMSNTVTNNLWPLPNIVAFAEAIRLVRVEAPNLVEVGKPIKLRCIYELRGEKLQSLAWYKNGREFYRYQPFERRQPVLTFGLAGVNVDVSILASSPVLLVPSCC